VGQFEDDAMVSVAQIDRSENLESRHVADRTVGGPRRPIKVDDNGIEGSLGSISPVNVPSIRSYWPTGSKLVPPKVGLSVSVMLIRVTRAVGTGAALRRATSKRAMPINRR